MLDDIREQLAEEWQPVSKPALVAWLAFYGLFLLHVYASRGNPITDMVFLPIHEGGHLLFGYLGVWPGVAGGTLLQLGVPLLLAAHFIWQRHLPGAVFCLFFFFENFLNVAIYMADARAQALPLVTVGDGDDAIHDWAFMLRGLGLLRYDTTIAGLTKFLGWAGMLGTLAWLGKRARAEEAA